MWSYREVQATGSSGSKGIVVGGPLFHGKEKIPSPEAEIEYLGYGCHSSI
jgi:hypothetical protein